jgi:sigma-B regulation protein RsbU (phosphoserine phosphatase)
VTDDIVVAYQQAACGLLTTDHTGLILAANQTLVDWVGGTHESLIGERAFIDLLTPGGRIYHETHYAPLLQMQGAAREIAFDLVRDDGSRFPVLVNARREVGVSDGIVHVAVFDATERRLYERELLAAKQRAEESERHARLLARTLQDTLLPNRVPDVPGLEVSAVYMPAGEGHEIGGDFYDVFQVANDDWVIVLGDVEGKGVEAALVTASVRYTVRAASVEHEPAGVLRIVNDVLLRDQSSRYCTAVIVRCRRRPSGWGLVIAAGGHPLPLLASAERCGPVGQHGHLLGMFADAKFHDVELELAPGQMLIAYTDGVTEARRGREMFGEEGLCGVTHGAAGGSARAVLDAVVRAALDFGGRPNADDIAAIAIATGATR